MDEADLGYLSKALDLAENGRGCTSPNPMVGAVLVKDGVTLGEGWHVGVGLDHAEVAAIKDALRRAKVRESKTAGQLDPELTRQVCRGATMYVSLEPCCTQGRTPPCTEALIRGGVSRVVVAALDPSPLVNGRGLRLLREAGITVDVAQGEIELRASRQNNGPRKHAATGLPFVEYKYAMTLDGRLSTDAGDSRWISSSESRVLVHQWRAWNDAVVVGARTVVADDPTLTAREVSCSRQPVRVVIDSECRLSRDSNLVRTVAEAPVLVVCSNKVPRERLAQVETWGPTTVTVGSDEEGRLDPEETCRMLAGRGVQAVLLEGGPRLAGSWWAAGLIDKVSAFVCPKVVSGRESGGALRGKGARSMHDAVGLQEVSVQQVGPDLLIRGYTGGPF